MARRKLYAVLSGIDDYPSPVRKLKGCASDVNQWKTYLSGQSDHFDIEYNILLNDQVTKTRLSESLQQSLSKADAGDVVLFFYSGHGTREAADPVFSEAENDEALESIVCYDSVRYDRGRIAYNLFCDKEIHYIISENARSGMHIVTIFDCCHSGSMSRNAIEGESNGECIEKRYLAKENPDHQAPMRRWHDFNFSVSVSRDEVESKGWHHVFSPKPHITLSACQHDESAFEQSGRGIFTSNLIKVLNDAEGSLSYHDLISQVRLLTKSKYRQTPEIYTIRHHEHELFKTFLDKHDIKHEVSALMYYRSSGSWCINLGALHGITKKSGPVHASMFDNEGLFISKVYATYSVLKIPDTLHQHLDTGETYRVKIASLFLKKTSFFLDKTIDSLKDAVSSWLEEHETAFTIVEEISEASYLITRDKSEIIIAQHDEVKTPVTFISLSEGDVSVMLTDYMQHIARWEFIREHQNNAKGVLQMPVVFSFYKMNGAGRKEIFPSKEMLLLDYDFADQQYRCNLKISLENKGNQKYYCAVLYLSNSFQVYGNMLDGKVCGLSPGEKAWIHNGDVIEVDLEPHVVQLNLPYSIFYLKLICSTKIFDVELLEQPPLPSPVLNEMKGAGQNKKPVSEKVSADHLEEWFTRTVCIKAKNPLYKK